jgi:hypothetical protein
LRSPGISPSSEYVRQKDELLLSGPALLELLEVVLRAGNSFGFRASGSSMRPCILDGDQIVIAPMPTEVLPRLGQVVAFVHPGSRKLAVHRVVGRRQDRFLLKGDSCCLSDGFIPAGSVLGYVAKVRRNGQDVRVGLGPERFLIAHWSRSCLLLRKLLDLVRRAVRTIVRRFRT